MARPDQGDVADAKVLDRPEGDRVEIGPAPEAAEDRPDQVAAAAETTGAEADENGRRERQRLRSVQEQQPLDDRGSLGRQLGPTQEAQGDQLADGNRVGHQRVRNDVGVGRVKANRRIEVQELAEPSRGGQ